jgi:hypothetical protein
VKWNGGDTLSYRGSGMVLEKPCSKVQSHELDSIYPTGWEIHEAKFEW